MLKVTISLMVLAVSTIHVKATFILQFVLVMTTLCFKGKTTATNLSTVRGTRTVMLDNLKIGVIRGQ